jgi:hypothetical protein
MALGFFLALGPLLLIAPQMKDQLYLPLAGLQRSNAMTERYIRSEVDTHLGAWGGRVVGSLGRLLFTHAPLILLVFLGASERRAPVTRLAVGLCLAVGGVQLLAWRPYDDYQVILAPFAFWLILEELAPEERRRRAALRPLLGLGLLALLAVPSWCRAWRRLEWSPEPYLLELARGGEILRKNTREGAKVLSLDAYLPLVAGRDPWPGLEFGRLSLGRAGAAGGVDPEQLQFAVRRRGPGALALPARDLTGKDPVKALREEARDAGYRRVARLEQFGEQRVELEIWGQEGAP